MDGLYKEALVNQFGASMDMFGGALRACPDQLWTARMWDDPSGPIGISEFWYIAFHTLFWLDLYLTGEVEGFAPPPPYTLAELDPKGILPERVYTCNELLSYLDYCHRKCTAVIEQLTDERARKVSYFPWAKGGISFIELMMDDMRHVQEHAAQLNMFLGQQAGVSSRWVGKG
jgi:hypothetical protein